MFTAQHYNAIAGLLASLPYRELLPGDRDPVYIRKGQITDALVDLLNADNPHFQEQRFRDACDRRV